MFQRRAISMSSRWWLTCSSEPPDQSAVVGDGQVQVVHRDEVDLEVGLRSPAAEVRLPVGDAVGADGRRGPIQRHLRHVHGDDLPPLLDQPGGVAALAGAQIEDPARRQVADHLDQPDVGPPAELPLDRAVALVPERGAEEGLEIRQFVHAAQRGTAGGPEQRRLPVRQVIVTRG